MGWTALIEISSTQPSSKLTVQWSKYKPWCSMNWVNHEAWTRIWVMGLRDSNGIWRTPLIVLTSQQHCDQHKSDELHPPEPSRFIFSAVISVCIREQPFPTLQHTPFIYLLSSKLTRCGKAEMTRTNGYIFVSRILVLWFQKKKEIMPCSLQMGKISHTLWLY